MLFTDFKITNVDNTATSSIHLVHLQVDLNCDGLQATSKIKWRENGLRYVPEWNKAGSDTTGNWCPTAKTKFFSGFALIFSWLTGAASHIVS